MTQIKIRAISKRPFNQIFKIYKKAVNLIKNNGVKVKCLLCPKNQKIY